MYVTYMKKWWKQILAAILITASVGAVSFAISGSVEEVPKKSDTPAVAQNRPPQPKSESPQVSGATTQQPQAPQQSTQPTDTPQPAPVSTPATNQQDQETIRRLAEERVKQQEVVRKLKCESIVASRDADILSEDSRHSNAIAAINADYRSRGLGFSGMLQAAIESENTNHQSKLHAINQRYQVELTSYGC